MTLMELFLDSPLARFFILNSDSCILYPQLPE